MGLRLVERSILGRERASTPVFPSEFPVFAMFVRRRRNRPAYFIQANVGEDDSVRITRTGFPGGGASPTTDHYTLLGSKIDYARLRTRVSLIPYRSMSLERNRQ